MPATQIESKHFFWHCEVAALLLEKLPSNTATAAHVGRAIRMATLCAAGKSGVRYASKRAIEEKGTSKKNWHECGFIKEHVVPVSYIHQFVVPALSLPDSERAVLATQFLAPADHVNWKLKDKAGQLAKPSTSLLIAGIVRDLTRLAWITKKDDQLLRINGLRKGMPGGWDGYDKFARYSACGIELLEIQPAPAPASARTFAL